MDTLAMFPYSGPSRPKSARPGTPPTPDPKK